jgi:putative membrane protein insertion efficiency factor
LSIDRIAKNSALALLRAYKLVISPLFPPACRYTPTCSEYASEAVERFGVLRGAFLAAWRLLRCHPFVRGGFDPVPIGKDHVGTGAPVPPAERSSARPTESWPVLDTGSTHP